jgi:hypothetical protein
MAPWRKSRRSKGGDGQGGGDDPRGGLAGRFRSAAEARAFEIAVQNELRALGREGLVRDGGIVLSDDTSLGLDSLAVECAAAGQSQWGRLISEHVRAVLAATELHEERQQLAQSLENVRERLVLRLYPEDYFPAGMTPVIRRDIPGLVTALMLDWEESAAAVRTELADAWGVERDELFRVALENVRRLEKGNAPTRLVEDEEGGLHMLEGRGIYASGLALALEDYPELTGAHGSIVGVPERTVLLAIPINHIGFVKGIGQLIRLVLHGSSEASYPVSRQVWWHRDGRWMDLPYRVDAAGAIHFAPPAEFNAFVGTLARR